MKRSAGQNRLRTFLPLLTRRQLEYVRCNWPFHGDPLQFPDEDVPPWTIWLVLGGRGAGKTRAGAEWVMGVAGGVTGFGPAASRIALVGETFASARDVMIEGPSGLLEVHARGERPVWSPALRKLEWRNGAVAHVFSAEDPDSLRGVPVTEVNARRGKYMRAEPVSVLYDKRRVHHVGAFPELEDEMCDFGPGGLSSGRSPDRLDALVWALHALMLQERAEPRVRAL